MADGCGERIKQKLHKNNLKNNQTVMDVSIIIVNYNTKDLLRQCIESVFAKTQDIVFEIIIVDNASSDGSQQMIKSLFPNIALVESFENLGFGKANNLGVKYAKGKYLFLLNSDTVLLNNAVKIFFDFYSQFPTHDTIGSIGAILLNKELVPTASFGVFPTAFNSLRFYWDKFLKKKYSHRNFFNKEQSFFPVDFICGADMFLARSTMSQMGGFDPCFFMYFEEVDLQKRMSNNALMCYIIDGPQIIHLEGGSFDTGTKSPKQRIMFDKSRFIYLKKHSNMFVYWLFRVVYSVLMLLILTDKRYSFRNRMKIFFNTFA